ncbi:MAG: phosphoribosylformylglycinamidine cyclo-ligase [Proteobacteria bacterium]|nr:phosphoribosylformylglycinamidine cyclo-ligase [Pseudomonadota bacterium]
MRIPKPHTTELKRPQLVETAYQKSGVDTDQARCALERMTQRIQTTWPAREGTGSVKLSLGYFANVIDIGGIGLALCTDGVGSKALVAQMVGRYDTIGIDCVAMNVNDLICVGAKPLSMVDYIAVEQPEPDFLDSISKGLCDGAEIAGISISGGETAQLRDIIKGAGKDFGFDLVGTAIGIVDLDKILIGQDIEHGDVVIGLESNGIHSNGLTLARHVFFEKNGFAIDAAFPELEKSLGDELLRPTHIYVKEVMEVLGSGVSVKALVHVTSDGLMNLTRVAADVGFVIDALPPAPPIFALIQRHGNVAMAEMFSVYNMGIGFCMIVGPKHADRVLAILESHGRKAYRIGHATTAAPRRVTLTAHDLTGEGKKFRPA